MSTLLLPLLFVIAIWWAGTGIVLYLQQRLDPRSSTLPIALAAACVASIVALWNTADSATSSGIGIAFIAAIVLWGVLELTYFMGIVTGTHREHCPAQCGAWQRFRLALGTSVYHELAVSAVGILLAVGLWQVANPVALYTFAVLWLMRWSAKLNLFLGVPNFNSEWFPERMAYLTSYMHRSRVTVLFPVSMVLAALAFIGLLHLTLDAEDSLALIYALPAFLLMLAMIEHAFMALPVADNELWNRIFNKSSNLS